MHMPLYCCCESSLLFLPFSLPSVKWRDRTRKFHVVSGRLGNLRYTNLRSLSLPGSSGRRGQCTLISRPRPPAPSRGFVVLLAGHLSPDPLQHLLGKGGGFFRFYGIILKKFPLFLGLPQPHCSRVPAKEGISVSSNNI